MADRDSQKKGVRTYYKVNRFIMPPRPVSILPDSTATAATGETFLFGFGRSGNLLHSEYFGATGGTPGHARRGGIINHVVESIDTSASAANVENMFTISVRRAAAAGGAPQGEPGRGRGAPLPSQLPNSQQLNALLISLSIIRSV